MEVKPLKDFTTKVVIGPDDRVHVQDSTIDPYRSVCYITVKLKNGSYVRGSGTVVSEFCVITAKHVVEDAAEINVYPGLNNRVAHLGAFKAVHWEAKDGDFRGDDRENDIAAIFTGAPMGSRPLWIDWDAKPKRVKLLGYPATVHDQGNSDKLWLAEGGVKDFDDGMVEHQADSTGGVSGGTVLTPEGGYFAVHVSGSESKQRNRAVLLREHKGLVERWLRWKPEGYQQPVSTWKDLSDKKNVSLAHWKFEVLRGDYFEKGECEGFVHRVLSGNQLLVRNLRNEPTMGTWSNRTPLEAIAEGFWTVEVPCLVLKAEGPSGPTLRVRTNWEHWKSFGLCAFTPPPSLREFTLKGRFYSDGVSRTNFFLDYYTTGPSDYEVLFGPPKLAKG